jgi:hypothetical protein
MGRRKISYTSCVSAYDFLEPHKQESQPPSPSLIPIRRIPEEEKMENTVSKTYNKIISMANNDDLLIERFPSGEVVKNKRSKELINQNAQVLHKAKKLAEYDEKVRIGRGKSPERERVVFIAKELVEKTKNQKNRSNVVQLIRGGKLSVIKDELIMKKELNT